MDHDDVPAGGLPQGLCVVRPARTVGPHFVDERLDRRDVRSDPGTGALRGGEQLDLTMTITRIVNGT